jgi:hypothetical protein
VALEASAITPTPAATSSGRGSRRRRAERIDPARSTTVPAELSAIAITAGHVPSIAPFGGVAPARCSSPASTRAASTAAVAAKVRKSIVAAVSRVTVRPGSTSSISPTAR